MRRVFRCATPVSVLASFVLAAVCGACGSDVPAELRVAGPHGFVRCLALAPPDAKEWRVGDLALELRGRALSVRTPHGALRAAAFTGPAPVATDVRPALRALVAARAELLLVLGGLGDDRASATRTARALAETGRLVLFLAGGRDTPEIVAAALDGLDAEARARVLDVSALERVRVAGAELLPLAGAPAGRYARGPDACGFTDADLDARADALGSGEGAARRVLLGWASPSPASGIDDGPAGSDAIARFAARVGARDVLTAWPREAAGVRSAGAGIRRVVPPIGGFAARTGTGGRSGPGAAWLSFGPSGVTEIAADAAPR
jgi:hypothetical protein